MGKFGDINYVKGMNAEGVAHLLGKPFTDPSCGRYLADLGLIMGLLPPPPGRILDLGVGSGWTTVFLARRGYEAIGQDICPEMIQLAEQNRERMEAKSASFVTQDYESLGFRDEFDAAIFYDSLHHAEDERAALAAVFAALKPGGVCITVEPGEGHAAASARTVATFGVTEKDMPPHHIISVGRATGFREFRVYGRPGDSGPAPAVTYGVSGPIMSASPSRWRIARGYLRQAIRAALVGGCEKDAELLFRIPMQDTLRSCSVVWMRK